MYINHFRKDFYDKLLGHRVLVIAGYDVDSVCAAKIFQYLFRVDENPYILVIADGIDDLKVKFKDYPTIRRVVLINCGGTIDIMNHFDNPADTVFFVLDSHRPTHVLNIYNETHQIRIVMPPVDEEEIPTFDDIFRPDEEEEEINSDDSSEEEEDQVGPAEDDEAGPSSAVQKPKRGIDKRVELAQKRKERREWESKRTALLFNYTKHNYHGLPASLIALEVAWSKSIPSSEIVWWAIVGLTEFYVLHRIDRANYTLLVSQMQNHVARITHETVESLSVLKITFENDLYLFLYRQWNLYASIRHTPEWRCKFRLWTSQGTQRLHAYLVEIGLPLKQVRQMFSSMDLKLRRELKPILSSRSEKYELTEDMFFGSFFAQYGYVYKFSALDHYLSASALLEEPGDKPLSTRFFNALQSLCKTKKPLVLEGIEISKQVIAGMISQVQILLDLKQIIVTNDLLYGVIQHGTLDVKYFSKPCSLIRLVQQTLEAFIACSPQGKNMRQLPLVLFVPKTAETHYVIGIPPIATNVSLNILGKAFEQIAKKMPNALSMDLFDTNISIIKSTEIEKFLETLMDLMA